MIVKLTTEFFYTKKAAPNKILIEAPTGGDGVTCISRSLSSGWR